MNSQMLFWVNIGSMGRIGRILSQNLKLLIDNGDIMSLNNYNNAIQIARQNRHSSVVQLMTNYSAKHWLLGYQCSDDLFFFGSIFSLLLAIFYREIFPATFCLAWKNLIANLRSCHKNNIDDIVATVANHFWRSAKGNRLMQTIFGMTEKITTIFTVRWLIRLNRKFFNCHFVFKILTNNNTNFLKQ